MGKAVDFEKIRKRRQRTTTLKRLLILVGVMVLVGAAVIANEILVQEGVTTKLSDFTSSLGGAGFPIDLPGGVIHDVDNIGKNLTILNDTSMYIYSPKGKLISNLQKMTDHSIAIPTSSRVLSFEIGGKGFKINSTSRELYANTVEYGILSADINERGYFALVSPVKQFASKVFVYNERFEEIYSWSSPEYVTNVSLSPNGEMMAINCIGGDGGVLESQIYTFRFSEEKEQAEVALTLPDNMVLDLSFEDDERITVLTDKQFLLLNSLGEQKKAYSFDGKHVVAMQKRERNTLLLLQEDGSKQQELVLLDANLSEKAAIIMPTEVKDIALGRETVYTLTADGIDVYNHSLVQKSAHAGKNISNIHLIDNRLYYLTLNEIRTLLQTELQAVPTQKSSSEAMRTRKSASNQSS